MQRLSGGFGYVFVGKVYLQSAIDCHIRYAFSWLYTSKLPVPALHMLNESVLPFFDGTTCQSLRCIQIMAGNSADATTGHPYELFMQLEGVEHRTIRGSVRKATAL